MPKIKKNPNQDVRSGRKTTDNETPASPAYITINEQDADSLAKNRTMWIVVGIFSVILAIFWLIILKINIQKATADIGFSQIGDQIAASLARFDTEIKNRSDAKIISAEDLAAIKTGVEQQIKSNPDSNLWPTHELTSLKIAIQYPDNWGKSESNRIITLTDANQNSSSSVEFGKIIISSKANAKKYDLATWLKKNSIVNDGYRAEQTLFPTASSSMESLVYNSTVAGPDQLKKIIYLNSTSSQTVWEIAITATGDLEFYRPLTEEIVRTIKIIK